MQDGLCFLFSPSASYPQPFACLIGRQAQIVHAWSSALDQPDAATDPPAYLRGWNHVELDNEGNLYVTVPLHALLKLRPDSTVIWRAELPVHHDLDVSPSGDVHVLTEEPRLIPWRKGVHLLLDHTVTILDRDGGVRAAHSLYDILTSHPVLERLIAIEIGRRRANAPLADPAALAFQTLAPGGRPGRAVSRLLRDLPGSPGDIIHANSVEVLDCHPQGLWGRGDVLVSLRGLDVIAVLDLEGRAVRWFWGPGQLSGQHQPSASPGGTVLVFDNGQTEGRSRVLEIDPVSDQVVWQFTADPPGSLFCAMAGGCEELSGGNILISDAQAGRAIEVTRDRRTAWTVQIHTLRSSAATSRAEFYRMSAVPATTAALLGRCDDPARQQVRSRLRCELINVLPNRRSAP